MSADKPSLYDTFVDHTSSLMTKADTIYHEALRPNKKHDTDTQIAALQNGSDKKVVVIKAQRESAQLARSTKERVSESMKAQYLQEAFKSIQEKNSFLLGAPKDFSQVRTSDLLSHLRNFPDDAKYFLLSQNGQAVEDRGHSQEKKKKKMIVNF